MQRCSCLWGALVVNLLAAGVLRADPVPVQDLDPKEQEAIAALRKLGAFVNLYKDKGDPTKRGAQSLSCLRVERLSEVLSLIRRLPRLQSLSLSGVTDQDL